MDLQAQNSNDTMRGSERTNPTNKLLVIVTVILLLACIGLGVVVFTQSKQIALHREAAILNREIIQTIDENVYAQFTKVDENAHGLTAEACLQIEETKPEYKKQVEYGTCDPHSDVFKPDYSSFTPTFVLTAKELNGIYQRLGIESVPDFTNKPAENYIEKAYPF